MKGFKKGNTFGQGRPKGAKNKATAELREFVNDLINDNKDKIQSDLDSLEPKERMDAMIKLMEFVVPKLQRTQLDADVLHKNEVVITFVPDEETNLKLN